MPKLRIGFRVKLENLILEENVFSMIKKIMAGHGLRDPKKIRF